MVPGTIKYDKEYVCFCMPLSVRTRAESLRNPVVFSMFSIVWNGNPFHFCPASHLEQHFKAEIVTCWAKSPRERKVGARTPPPQTTGNTYVFMFHSPCRGLAEPLRKPMVFWYLLRCMQCARSPWVVCRSSGQPFSSTNGKVLSAFHDRSANVLTFLLLSLHFSDRNSLFYFPLSAWKVPEP